MVRFNLKIEEYTIINVPGLTSLGFRAAALADRGLQGLDLRYAMDGSCYSLPSMCMLSGFEFAVFPYSLVVWQPL